MLTDSQVLIVVQKKNDELEALGVTPKLFSLMCNYLNRYYYLIYTNDFKIYIFEKPRKQSFFHLASPNSSTEQILTEIKKIFSCSHEEGNLVISEWVRDRKIYLRMVDKSTKYHHWLILPDDLSKAKEMYGF